MSRIEHLSPVPMSPTSIFEIYVRFPDRGDVWSSHEPGWKGYSLHVQLVEYFTTGGVTFKTARAGTGTRSKLEESPRYSAKKLRDLAVSPSTIQLAQNMVDQLRAKLEI
jgi:hypothetical protein